MKIQIKSDLHKESRLSEYTARGGPAKSLMNPEADVLILAGDISDYPNRFNLHHELTRLPVGKKIIYVPGNHEYYGAPSAQIVVDELRELYKGTDVLVMDRGVVAIGDVNFIGATLWSDISNPINEQVAAHYLNDFRVRGLSTGWYIEQHHKSVKYIEQVLKNTSTNPLKTVVVTHHGPSPLSSSPRYRGAAENCCFHTDLSELILAYHPILWVHGHTHDPFDYPLEESRILCNPRGYPGEHNRTRPYDPENPSLHYNDDLIIEI